MMKTCECGKSFLTESDAYVVLPQPSGTEYNCGCFFAEATFPLKVPNEHVHVCNGTNVFDLAFLLPMIGLIIFIAYKLLT